MDISEILPLINGKIVTAAQGAVSEIKNAFASDLMSDVLTLDDENLILITGLCTQQVIRTAEMSDIEYVVIARGKRIPEDVSRLAEDHDITLISSDYSLFKICGILYPHLNSIY